MRKLLLGTTSKHKATEMRAFLETLPFEIISLSDLPVIPDAPEEGETSLRENAILKATYYGNATGELCLADDAGIFIDALGGWPGVISALVAPTYEEITTIVLEKMKGIAKEKRGAEFRSVLALYDPLTQNLFVAEAGLRGTMLEKPAENGHASWGYNSLFFVDDVGLAYSQMTPDEKNNVSHRGIALQKIKYHLQNTYSGRHIVVPIAFIIKNGTIFMQKRNDPFRPEFHGKWEFPGGSVEMGETVEETLIREVREETGYDVEIIGPPLMMRTKHVDEPTFRYQLYLPSFVCRITGGTASTRDQEVLEQRWFPLDEIPTLNLFEGDGEMFATLRPAIDRIISEHPEH